MTHPARFLAGLMMMAWAWTQPPVAQAFDHSHAAWGEVLRRHVREGRVAYGDLKEDPERLDYYLDEAAGVSEPAFNAWPMPEQLAFLINLYNAATLRLILDHYPVKSIKRARSLFKGPWEQRVVRLWGGTITLDQLEHDLIRKRYEVPEIHFALVCAAKGCPPLRGEPYVPRRLRQQLEDQARTFLADPNKNSLDPETRRMNLSPLFKWYREDFEKAAGSLPAYLKSYWPHVDDTFSVRFTRYDWSLNEP